LYLTSFIKEPMWASINDSMHSLRFCADKA
jgi:hypothetical protein